MKYEVGESYREKRGPRKWKILDSSLDQQTACYQVEDPDGNVSWKTQGELAAKVSKPREKGVVYVSPSQISLFARCQRKWAFKYIEKIPEPMKSDPAFGIESHEALEAYLKTGKFPKDTAPDVLAATAQGLKHLPDPEKQKISVEHAFDFKILDGRARFIGYIDLLIYSEDGIPAVIDHKFTKNLRYAMSQKAMEADIQANSYAFYASNQFNTSSVTTRWLYYGATPVNGQRPRETVGFRKVERTKDSEEIQKNWQTILGHAEQIVQLRTKAAQDSSMKANDCEPNSKACWDYGGCFYRSRCRSNQGGFMMSSSQTTKKKGTKMSKLAEILKKKQAEKKSEAPEGINPPPVHKLHTPEISAKRKESRDKTEEIKAKKAAEAIAGAEKRRAKASPPEIKKTKRRRRTKREILAEEALKAALEEGADCEEEKAELQAATLEAEEQRAGRRLKKAARQGLAVTKPDPTPPPNPVETKPPEPAQGFMLAVDTVVAKGAMKTLSLSEFLEEMQTAIETENEVTHWNLVPYRQGESILAGMVKKALSECKPQFLLLCDSRSDEWKACGGVLTSNADMVFRGL